MNTEVSRSRRPITVQGDFFNQRPLEVTDIMTVCCYQLFSFLLLHSNRPVPGQRSEVTGHSSRFCHRLVLQTVLFFFSRFEGEYETSRAEQLVPGTDPDRRPLFVHQSVLRPHRCNPATGGSAALSLPWLNASKQTQPTPQHRLVMGGSWGGQ